MKRFTITREIRTTGMTKSVIDMDTSVEAYYNTTFSGKFDTMIFMGKSNKPVYHYSFKSEQERADYVQKVITTRWNRIIAERKAKEETKAMNVVLAQNVQVGDLFHCGWGYSMSLNNFYQVISKKGSKVTLCGVTSKYVDGNYGGGHTSAVKDTFVGEVFTKILKGDSIKVNDYNYARKCSEDDAFYENHID
jgi:hypothetical protein